jgi:hypothetical protein
MPFARSPGHFGMGEGAPQMLARKELEAAGRPVAFLAKVIGGEGENGKV